MTDKTDPAIGFSLQCKINDKRDLVFQTHMERDAANGALYKMIEKCADAADLVDVRYRLKDMKVSVRKFKEELPIHETKLKNYQTEAYNKHAKSGRRGEFKLSNAEQSSYDNMVMNVATLRQTIERYERDIAEAEGELANALAGTADHQPSAPDS